MRMKFFSFAFCLMFSVACSCGVPGAVPPVDPSKAQDLADLELWKARVVKSCTVDDAFPRLASGAPKRDSVDASALMAKTRGSRTISDGTGSVWVGVPASRTGSGFSEASRVSSSGETYEVRLEREGSACIVKINKVEVYKTELVASFPLIAHYSPDKLATANANAAAGAITYKEAVGPGGPVAFVEAAPSFFRPLRDALTPVAPASVALVAKVLGVTEVEAAAVFIPASTFDRLGTVEMVTPAGVSPFVSDGSPSFLMADAAALAPLKQPGMGTFELDFLVRQSGRLSANPNELSPRLWRVRAKISTAVTAVGAALQLRPTLVALDLKEDRAFDDAAGLGCVKGRLALSYIFHRDVLKANEGTAVVPPLRAVTEGCEALSADLTSAIAKDSAVRSLLVTHLEARAAGATQPATFQYQGWDQLIANLADKSFNEGRSLRTDLAPVTGSVVDKFVGYADGLLTGVQDPALKKQFSAGLMQVARAWAFRKAPESGVPAAVVAAVNRSGASFSKSVDALLFAVADGNAQNGLACAASYDDTLAQAFLAVVKKASGAVAGPPMQTRKDTFLQLCPNPAKVDGWNLAVDAVAAFATEESARARGPSFARNLAEVAEVAINEAWTKETFATFGQIAAFVRTSSTLCGDKEAWSDLAACEDLEIFSARTGSLLAATFAGRYGTFATRLTAIFPEVKMASFPAARTVTSALLSLQPAWRKCNNAVFGDKVDSLILTLKTLSTTTGSKFQLEQSVEEQLNSDC